MMEERRSIIRCECFERAKYCVAEDQTPYEGRLTSLTERGLGLLTHEPRKLGERLTVSFVLPGEEESLTTAGVVRWVSQSPSQKRWYPLGLEWLPLEETTRFRLDTFLRNYAQTQQRQALEKVQPLHTKWWKLRVVRWGLPAVVSLFVIIGLLARVIALQQTTVQLGDGIIQRNLEIGRLNRSEERMRQDLALAASQLTATLAQVGQETTQFRTDLKRLADEVGLFQAAYTVLRGEHERLRQRVSELEQERARLVQRLSEASRPQEPAQPGVGDSKTAVSPQ